ncbi:MAG: NAD-dependent epimerase, partial [Sphingobacteriales bacterium]
MKQEKILIMGAGGQIGVELTLALRNLYGKDNVIATDLKAEPHPLLAGEGPY